VVVVEVEAAIARHAAFCRALGCRSPAAAERLIAAVRRLLRGAGEGGRKEKAKAVVVLEFHDAWDDRSKICCSPMALAIASPSLFLF
jgi:hypothetical protein